MINNIYKIIIYILDNLSKRKFHLFTQHPNYFGTIQNAKKYVGEFDVKVVENFEEKFSRIIGDGYSVSFGAGRMGFYSLMKILKIQKGDEVIICSGTCSVMVNAILKLNAVPIFSDICEYTMGSDLNGIKNKITSKTKLIVAQHNFGIPCSIVEIKSFCNLNNIFLLEDCALSLGSKYNGINVGTFGDASLFSLDHSKPLPVFTGGIIYSKNLELNLKLKKYRDELQDLNKTKQKAIFNKLSVNNKLNHPKLYRFLFLANISTSIKIKMGFTSPYLDENYRAYSDKETYEYPSKMPAFIAYLGLRLIENWDKIIENRLKNFHFILNSFKTSKFHDCIPDIYFDSKFEIIPLRFILIDSNNVNLESLLSKYIDIKSTWFKSPVISTNDKLLSFNYKSNSCPKSELLGKQIINLPLEYKITEINKIL